MCKQRAQSGLSERKNASAQYNGEYAKEGEEWPPAEAFSGVPEGDHPSTAPSRQADATSSASPVSRPAGAIRHTKSAQEVSIASLHAI